MGCWSTLCATCSCLVMPVSKLPTATFGIGWHASHDTLYTSAVKIHKCIFVALGLIVFHVKHPIASVAPTKLAWVGMTEHEDVVCVARQH